MDGTMSARWGHASANPIITYFEFRHRVEARSNAGKVERNKDALKASVRFIGATGATHVGGKPLGSSSTRNWAHTLPA